MFIKSQHAKINLAKIMGDTFHFIKQRNKDEIESY
jgi:hypothetical protein